MGKPKCECGGVSFRELKMGGSGFRLQWAAKVNFWKCSGFEPDAYACLSCGKVHFYVPEKEWQDTLED